MSFVLAVFLVGIISWVLVLRFINTAVEQQDRQQARGAPMTEYEAWARKYEGWIENHPGEIPPEYEGHEAVFRAFEAQYRLYRTLAPSTD